MLGSVHENGYNHQHDYRGAEPGGQTQQSGLCCGPGLQVEILTVITGSESETFDHLYPDGPFNHRIQILLLKWLQHQQFFP